MPSVDTREVGLEIGATVFKYFLNTEYLHYGYFSNDLAVTPQNLAAAQIRYADLLRSNIPAGTKTILDVGCGTGRFALDLIISGYTVAGVSPGTVLTAHARRVIGDRGHIYNCKFEDLVTDARYDLVLFSESFQYIDPVRALTGARRLLNPGGHILICDIFKTDPTNACRIGGGHDLDRFLGTVREQPLSLIREQDITQETAGTIDLANRLSQEVLHPTYQLILRTLDDRYPRLARLVKWKYRKKLAKIEARHFSGERTGEHFMRYKKYMLYVFASTNAAPDHL